MRFIPHWRKMTWAILIFTALMAIWAIAGAGSADNHAYCLRHHGVLTVQECEDARNTGTGIGVFLLFLLWMTGFIILSIIWFMTRPRGVRTCPTCGSDVKKGRFVCGNCGYDFRSGHHAVTAVGAGFDVQTGRPNEPAPRFDPQTGMPLKHPVPQEGRTQALPPQALPPEPVPSPPTRVFSRAAEIRARLGSEARFDPDTGEPLE
jgi:hypothetical protein